MVWFRAPRKLRIAYVTPTFPPYRGGMGNVAYHNGVQLARRGHEIHVFTPQLPWASDTGPLGLPVRRLSPALRLRHASLTPGLLVRLRGYDLVHVHCPFVFGAEVAWLACQIRSIPFVVTYHQDLVFSGALATAAGAYQWLEERLVLRSARWVAATTDDYARHSRLKHLPPDHVVVLPNGVDTDSFRPGLDASPFRRRYGLGNDDHVIVFVGALDRAHYFKGVSVLLDAVARLPTVRLVVVGDGDLRADYQHAAAVANVEHRVQFVGAIADAELPYHYALADVVVLPSTTRGEAFGLVLIEAMASGIPVIATTLPGVRVVVDHGTNGLLVPPGDAVALAEAIAELMSDATRRRRMGHEGRRKAETLYEWRLRGPDLERLYLRALDGNRSRSASLRG